MPDGEFFSGAQRGVGGLHRRPRSSWRGARGWLFVIGFVTAVGTGCRSSEVRLAIRNDSDQRLEHVTASLGGDRHHRARRGRGVHRHSVEGLGAPVEVLAAEWRNRRAADRRGPVCDSWDAWKYPGGHRTGGWGEARGQTVGAVVGSRLHPRPQGASFLSLDPATLVDFHLGSLDARRFVLSLDRCGRQGLGAATEVKRWRIVP